MSPCRLALERAPGPASTVLYMRPTTCKLYAQERNATQRRPAHLDA
jgi:hypothetical protein